MISPRAIKIISSVILLASPLTVVAEDNSTPLNQPQQENKSNKDNNVFKNINVTGSLPIEIKGNLTTGLLVSSDKETMESYSTSSNTLYSSMASKSNFRTSASLFALADITDKMQATAGVQGYFESTMNKSSSDAFTTENQISEKNKNQIIAKLKYNFNPNNEISVGNVDLQPAHLLGHNAMDSNMYSSINFTTNFYGTKLLLTRHIGQSDWSFSAEPFYGFGPEQVTDLAHTDYASSGAYVKNVSYTAEEIWGGLAEFGNKYIKLLYGHQSFYFNDTSSAFTVLSDLSSNHTLDLYAADLSPSPKLEILPFYAQMKNDSNYLANTDSYGAIIKYMINDRLSPFAWYDKDRVKESVTTDMVSASEGDSFGVGTRYMINKNIMALVNISNRNINTQSSSNSTSNLNAYQALARIDISF